MKKQYSFLAKGLLVAATLGSCQRGVYTPISSTTSYHSQPVPTVAEPLVLEASAAPAVAVPMIAPARTATILALPAAPIHSASANSVELVQSTSLRLETHAQRVSSEPSTRRPTVKRKSNGKTVWIIVGVAVLAALVRILAASIRQAVIAQQQKSRRYRRLFCCWAILEKTFTNLRFRCFPPPGAQRKSLPGVAQVRRSGRSVSTLETRSCQARLHRLLQECYRR